MTTKELIFKIKAMRDAQKEYFRTRSSEALAESKRLEKEVDDVVQRGVDYYHRRDVVEQIKTELKLEEITPKNQEQ